MKRVLITGITGQDGSYLAELLLNKGYEVHGIMRRASAFNTARIDHIYQDPHEPCAHLFLHYGDLTASEQFTNLLYNYQFDEVYHLAAQSHVKVSFDVPEYTGDTTGLGTIRLLESIRRSGRKTKFYQASSSEMFGLAPAPQNEATRFHPRSPYATAKLYSYWTTTLYREAYGIFACNGILFNHESPRRGETFVTRKITRGVAAIVGGKQEKIFLGNLQAERDWGYAPEYVEGMWRILQHEEPSDFVLGTGEKHSVSEFAQEAFAYVGLDWKDYVEEDIRYFRPSEVHSLQADYSRARLLLGWEPRIKFKQLVRIMVDADLEAIGLPAVGDGARILTQEFGSWHQWSTAVSKVLNSAMGAAIER